MALLPPILLIESDQPTIELYRRELSHDYQVVACSTQAAALDMLQTHDFAAIVLEPTINASDQWGVLIAIKAQPHSHVIPIIICTTLDQRSRGFALGADAYLLKPTLPTTLRETLHSVMKQ